MINTRACLALGAAPVHAANVYILSSGDPTLDSVVQSTLQARGHSATIGVQFSSFDGSTTEPVVNVLDFSCFLNRFAAGCN